MSFYYPALDHGTVKNLLIVRQLIESHPAYFLESSYSPALEADLLTLLKHTKTPTSELPTQAEQDELDLENELKTLYTGLKTAKPGLDDSGDAMSYYRTSTALLEKLLGLRDKAQGHKQMSDHYALVLQFLEDICSPIQVSEFLRRLEESTK